MSGKAAAPAADAAALAHSTSALFSRVACDPSKLSADATSSLQNEVSAALQKVCEVYRECRCALERQLAKFETDELKPAEGTPQHAALKETQQRLGKRLHDVYHNNKAIHEQLKIDHISGLQSAPASPSLQQYAEALKLLDQSPLLSPGAHDNKFPLPTLRIDSLLPLRQHLSELWGRIDQAAAAAPTRSSIPSSKEPKKPISKPIPEPISKPIPKPATTSKDSKYALVIGNDAYDKDPLKNACNDARRMSTKLEELGYTVTLKLDIESVEAFKAVVNTFVDNLRDGKQVLFYYAGHAAEDRIDEKTSGNVLSPTRRDQGSGREHITLQFIHQRFSTRHPTFMGFILDACRTNWKHGARSEEQSGSWIIPRSHSNVFYSFGCSPTETCSDNRDENNGLFTKHLLPALSCELDISQMLRKVCAAVVTESRGCQRPWFNESIVTSRFVL